MKTLKALRKKNHVLNTSLWAINRMEEIINARIKELENEVTVLEGNRPEPQSLADEAYLSERNKLLGRIDELKKLLG